MSNLPYLNLFQKKYSAKRDAHKAIKLLKKLWRLRLVKFVVFLVWLFVTIPPIVFLFIRPKVQEDISYGVSFSNIYATELGLDWQQTYIDILENLGPDSVRLVVYWKDVEPIRNSYNFSDIKWQLDEAKRRNVNVILAVGRKVPRWPECFEPTWWRGLEDENVKEEEVIEFVKQAVIQLKGYDNIVMWQIENEPFWKFGDCPILSYSTVAKEVNAVRALDDRPILVQDSGEGGLWRPTYVLGDKLGISMYRKIWFDFWGVIFGRSFYFKYPLAHWTYKVRAVLTGVPTDQIIVTELQAEPWGPRINSELTQYEKDQTMSTEDFLDAISYAQKAGFDEDYLWGAEWWYWELTQNGNGFYWNTARELLN